MHVWRLRSEPAFLGARYHDDPLAEVLGWIMAAEPSSAPSIRPVSTLVFPTELAGVGSGEVPMAWGAIATRQKAKVTSVHDCASRHDDGSKVPPDR